MRIEVHFSFIDYTYYNHLIIFLLLFLFPLKSFGGDNLAFPGAMGWGAETRGAWSGVTGDDEPTILRVTSLSGGLEEGTFRWAMNQPYPRIIVFEVGGVINFGGNERSITEPYVTIAGQTAPSPGITIINGGLRVRTKDFIIQHIMMRAGASDHEVGEYEPNSFSTTTGAKHGIIDHCSATWAIDENLSLGGRRYDGDTFEEWQNNTSNHITVSNCIIAEALEDATHSRGEHSYGTLLIDGVNHFALLRNLFAHNRARNPMFYAAWGVIANNYQYNHGTAATSVLWTHDGWETYLHGNWDGFSKLTYVGNHGRRGVDSRTDRWMIQSNVKYDVLFYFDDNILFDVDNTPLEPLVVEGGLSGSLVYQEKPPVWHDNIELLPSGEVLSYIESNVGARPWDRDPIDQRIVSEALNGTGSIIDHENEREGLPNYEPTYRVFNPDEWDLRYMIPHAGYWEAPELTSPKNNGVDIGQSPTFSWEALNHLTHFTLQISTDENFSSLVFDESGITDAGYTVNNLDGSTTYYWRVRGHNTTGPSQWSDVWQFHTDEIASTPVLVSPESGASVTPDNVLLEWEAANNAESYTVQVSTQSNFSSIVAEGNTITETNFEVTELEIPAIYYWRVRANNSSIGNSSWSEVWQFSTEAESEIGSHDIYLNTGWNQISSFIEPENSAIENVFADIQGNLVMVKNDNTGVYWPEIEINEIGEWNPQHGYQVYVEDGDILEFTGTQLLPEQHPINLQQGWNQVAYLRTTPMNVDEALAGIDNEIEIVSNNAGEVYWPEYDINSLVTMEPGQGYKISVTSDVTLTYPANDEGEPAQKIVEKLVSQSVSEHSNRPRHYNVDFGNTGDFAILLLLSSDLADGDEVGVRSPSNELVGSGVAQNGKALVTVWGRNPVLNDEPNIHGAVNGDALRLTQWSIQEDREYPVTVTQVRDRVHHQFANTLLRYQSDAVWIVDAKALNEIPRRYTLEQNYPNPFNPITTIRYGIPEPVRVRLEVYNTIGQRIKVLVEEEKQAGYHQVIFDANDLASGIYFYRLQAGNYTTMKRAVLLR